MKLYVPALSFAAWQAANPASPLSGRHLDVELAEIADRIGDLNDHFSSPTWARVSADPSLVECAMGLGTGSTTSVSSVAPPYDYRLGVYQGIPPMGPATATDVDYGRGAQPTYVRFEMRRGPAPSAAEIGPEWETTTSDGVYYPDGPRARIERGFTNSTIGFKGAVHPDPATTYFYEASIYLPETFPLAHLRGLGTVSSVVTGQLPILSVGPSNAPGDGVSYSSALTLVGASADGPHMRMRLLRELNDGDKTVVLGTDADFLGRWNTIRVEAQFSESAAVRVLLNGVEVKAWVDVLTLLPEENLRVLAPQYGLYVLGSGLTPADFYGDGRETSVLYAAVKFGVVA